jgi:hypothetical protein
MTEAGTLVQADTGKYRGEAVVHVADGSYWAAQLAGTVDQVDGEYYTAGNNLHPETSANDYPHITSTYPGVEAVVGLETDWDLTKPGGTPTGAGS